MTESFTNPATDRRPQHVAVFGLVLQLISFVTLLGISIWSQSDAMAPVARFMVIGLPIWFVLVLLYSQMHRVNAEALETAELKRAQAESGSEAIFELDDEALLIERNRLRWLVRWMLPSVTVVVAIVLFGGHFVGWGYSLDSAFKPGGVRRAQEPILMMWFVVGVGFLSFLYARYALALSRLPQWQLLRAGATCMAGNAFACLGLVIALMAGSTIGWVEPLFAYLMRIVLLMLGVEFTVNFVLDFYRPRTEPGIPRPSFDSRLLGLVSDPGGIAKSIADAVNYQFGFEVSSTWFYQLLQRWLFPIMVFTLVVVLLLSCVVIVDADEQVMVERFGRHVSDPPQILGPGFHLKWPYPVDIAYRAPVKRISELVIGEATGEEQDAQQPIIWTEAHEYIPELMLLVASPTLVDLSLGELGGPQRRGKAESVAVSLLMVSVPIEYRIKDVNDYLYRYDDPVKLTEEVAYQYLSNFAASVDIDELMGPGRERFNAQLREHIQQRLDDLRVGIEIVFAGIRGAHPPAKNKVADAFQSVVSAQTHMAATINAAGGEAQKILTAVAGTETRALGLDEAIRRRDALQSESPPDENALAEAEQQVQRLLLGDPTAGITPLSGEAAAIIAAARADASELISDAAGKARAFASEVVAWTTARELYKQRKWLEVFENLDHIRKYLIVGDPDNVIIEYLTAEEGGLDRVLSEGLEGKDK